MPTSAQITEYSERIFNAARGGTPKNKAGLPVVLSALLVAQARHETGNYTSRHFIQSRNAFGYSFDPRSAWQTGSGGIADNNSPVGVYDSIEDSTREVVDWIYRRVADGKFPADLSSIVTPERYAELLRSAGYYTAPLSVYAGGLAKWFEAMPQTTFSWVLLFALVWFLLRQWSKK